MSLQIRSLSQAVWAALVLTTAAAFDCAQAAAAEPVAAASASPETRPRNNTAFSPALKGQTRAPGIKTSVKLDVTTVAKGLSNPWAFEFLPDGRVLLTERGGQLRIVDSSGKLSEPLRGLPPVLFEGQGGLLDVALDPQFATNRTIYWSYAQPRQDGNGTALAKGTLVEDASGARVEGAKVIFQQMPSLRSNLHFGSRIVFTSNGKQLYLSLGERSIPAGRVQAQDLGSHFGKIIRINLDGSVPSDNPFVGRSGAKPEIWSSGHRNVQAATLDLQGRLWDIEHGPRGGDELNRPEAGKNYGWPVIGYGIDYSGEKMHDASAKAGMEQPVYYWDPVIAPSGMIFYSGKLAPEWRGNIFVGGMASTKLVRLQLDGDKVVGEEWLLEERRSRIRDVKEAADGSIYVLADGITPSLLRIAPQPSAL